MGYQPRISGGGGGGNAAYSIASPPGGSFALLLSYAQQLVPVVPGDIVTIPANADVAFPVGSWIDLLCDSASFSDSFSIVPAAGVTFAWSNANPSGAYIYGAQTYRLIKTDTDEWYLTTAPPIFANGILKSDGNGGTNAAVAGTDYSLTLQQALAASGITPCPDGTVTPVTSITTIQGIITAIS